MDRLCITLTVAMTLACFIYVEANVFSLGSMIEWMDPKLNSVIGVYSHFNNYGCYCGIGGHGRPIDQVDCCCQAHDECYEKLISEGYCASNEELSHLYSYRKITDKTTGRKQLQCMRKADDPCAYHLCQCDAKVAKCFAASEPHYNEDHRHYNRTGGCDLEQGLRAEICNNDYIEL